MNGDLQRLMAQVARSQRRRSHTFFSQEGITHGQPRILDYLGENDGCIQRDLAEHCHLEPATVTSVVFNMEKAGLIERRANPADRRVLCVWLTDKGKDTRKTIGQINERLEKECFEGFREDETEQMRDFLTRILENIRKAEN